MKINNEEKIKRAMSFLNLLINYEGKGYTISRICAEAGISSNAGLAAQALKYISNRTPKYKCNIIKVEPHHARKLREKITEIEREFMKKKPNQINEKKVIKTKPKYIEQKPKKKKSFNYIKATFIGSLVAASIATAALCLSFFK